MLDEDSSKIFVILAMERDIGHEWKQNSAISNFENSCSEADMISTKILLVWCSPNPGARSRVSPGG